MGDTRTIDGTAACGRAVTLLAGWDRERDNYTIATLYYPDTGEERAQTVTIDEVERVRTATVLRRMARRDADELVPIYLLTGRG